MSYQRSVLKTVGLLDNLVALFIQRLGNAEHAVLSAMAAQYGELYILGETLAIHPPRHSAFQSAGATAGWHKGLTETLGRAYTMRWLAVDRRAYLLSWMRVATLEIIRAIKWGILKRPS